MFRKHEIGYHLENTSGIIILSNLNIRFQNGSGMYNIKTDETATLCCVRCGLTGEDQLFLKTEAVRGRGKWLFTFRLRSLCD
jgi:hypothetical protein